MELEISDDAAALLTKRGGTISIDFIRPTGCGKIAEVSVDTNTTNKNLAPYTQVRHPEFTILVSPVLSGLASQMRIVTKGKILKQLAVELSDEPHRPAYAPRDRC